MNIKVDVDITAKEVRSLMGLPDMDVFWDKTFSDSDLIKNKLTEIVKQNTLKIMDPLNIMKMRDKK